MVLPFWCAGYGAIAKRCRNLDGANSISHRFAGPRLNEPTRGVEPPTRALRMRWFIKMGGTTGFVRLAVSPQTPFARAG